MIENDSLTELHAGRISFMQYLAEDASDDRKSGAGTAQNFAAGLLAVIAAELLGLHAYWVLVVALVVGGCVASALLPHPYVLFRIHDERRAKRVADALGISCIALLLIAAIARVRL